MYNTLIPLVPVYRVCDVLLDLCTCHARFLGFFFHVEFIFQEMAIMLTFYRLQKGFVVLYSSKFWLIIIYFRKCWNWNLLFRWYLFLMQLLISIYNCTMCLLNIPCFISIEMFILIEYCLQAVSFNFLTHLVSSRYILLLYITILLVRVMK